MKTFTKYPKSYIRAASNPSDFVIEDGVLKKYVGPGGDVVIPDGVREIGNESFQHCTSLTSVTIPGGVTSIGDSAFRGCYSLTTATIPSSVTSIVDRAFYSCSSLTNIHIPEGVTYIGYCVFEYCSSLTSATIPEGVTVIDYSAFGYCSSLTSITIPDSVTRIGYCAFYKCSSLTTITIPEGVTYIDKGAFASCSSLASVNILGNPKIEMSAFNNTPVESQFGTKKKSTSKKRSRKFLESFDKWYESEKGEEDNSIFAEELERIVLKKFPGADYFEEPSVQGLEGGDFVTLTVDGTTYSFEFDYRAQQETIFEKGPKAAAKYYYNQIINNMDEEHIVED